MAQRWRPDTCGCEVEELVAPDGSKTFGGVVTKCPAHATVPDALLYDVLYAGPNGENKRKNQAHSALLAENELAEDVTVRGQRMRQFRGQIDWAWSWTGSGATRELEVVLVGATLTAATKARLQAQFVGRGVRFL